MVPAPGVLVTLMNTRWFRTTVAGLAEPATVGATASV